AINKDDWVIEGTYQESFDKEADKWVISYETKVLSDIKQAECRIEIEDGYYRVMTYLPFKASDNNKDQCMEFISISNNGNFNGSFGMEWESGRIYYKESICLMGDTELNEEILNSSRWTPIASLVLHEPGFRAIFESNMTAKEADRIVRESDPKLQQ
ncbi:MAG: hypothetical protein K6G03_10935, partial [Lachnospiraceae bacterium]|nr:hypothetical protein [Lachnospiraceae bacterium]